MDQEFITGYEKSSRTWHRPTWMTSPDGYEIRGANSANTCRASSDSGLEASPPRKPRKKTSKIHLSRPALADLAILGLDETATMNDIKRVYKRMVKKYHPDIVGQDKTKGDLGSAEIFRNVTAAYQAILKRISLKP